MKEIGIENLTLRYADGKKSLKNITLTIHPHAINVIFGPADSGKSTLLRTLNRLNELSDVDSIEGKIWLDGENILGKQVNALELRQRMSIVFSNASALPASIYENIVYGLRISGENQKEVLEKRVETSLKLVGLWDEVRNSLDGSAGTLSGEQIKLLALARALAVEPEVLLLDEPTFGLDNSTSLKIEHLLGCLKKDVTIIAAVQDPQQAARIADHASFLYKGELIESGDAKLFSFPSKQLTKEYIKGGFPNPASSRYN